MLYPCFSMTSKYLFINEEYKDFTLEGFSLLMVAATAVIFSSILFWPTLLLFPSDIIATISDWTLMPSQFISYPPEGLTYNFVDLNHTFLFFCHPDTYWHFLPCKWKTIFILIKILYVLCTNLFNITSLIIFILSNV